MGRGGYLGGGTVINIWSDWFSGHDASRGTKVVKKAKAKKKSPSRLARLSPEVRAKRSAQDFARNVRSAQEKGTGIPPVPRRLRARFATFTPDQILVWALQGTDVPQPSSPEPLAKADLLTAPRKPPVSVEGGADVRRQYLCGVLAARAQRTVPPNPPKQYRLWLVAEIESAGGLDSWASAQPTFREVSARAAKRAGRVTSSGRLKAVGGRASLLPRPFKPRSDPFAASAAQKPFSNLET